MPNALFLSQLSLGTPKYHLVAKNFLLGHYGIDITLYMWIFFTLLTKPRLTPRESI